MTFGGVGSSSAVSSFAAGPLRAYGQPAKLWATKRSTPTARPADNRWSVPSVRRRLVSSKDCSNLRRSMSLSAVS